MKLIKQIILEKLIKYHEKKLCKYVGMFVGKNVIEVEKYRTIN